VTKINAPDSDGSTVQIAFKVEDGLRGASSGDIVVVREWAGLWTGRPHYRIGEKVLIFLHASEQNGLTSPVGGPAGIFRFANDSTLKLSESQQRAIMRSPRLRDALGQSQADLPRKNVPAVDFLRALRLAVAAP
jgi:hypothetical protein